MVLTTDILVVGSGIAGTLFALELASLRSDLLITMISQGKAKQSSSFLAQGGIAASFPVDKLGTQQHIEDTIVAGNYLNDKRVVQKIIQSSYAVINTLEKWGVIFDKDQNNQYELGLEGGHSKNRIFHHKDYTGQHIINKLHSQLETTFNINLIEHVELLELYKHSNQVQGGLLWDHEKNRSISIHFTTVVMATGGLGNLYRNTTNPPTSTGTALSIVKKMGCNLSNCHYIQFHPTAIYSEREGRSPLISEALRGAGAILRNERGIAFMAHEHPLKDLAPRDIVSRCIIHQINKQQKPYVYLDCTHLYFPEFMIDFPQIYATCLQYRINPEIDFIPVIPVAHYTCGGVVTDSNGNTNVNGLKVIGEAANTGFHGANRLASNSLLEAAFMAIQLSAKWKYSIIKKEVKTTIRSIPNLKFIQKDANHYKLYKEKIKTLLYHNANVIKNDKGLYWAKKEIQAMEKRVHLHFKNNSMSKWQALNLISSALLIINESIDQARNVGVYFNTDRVTNNVKINIK